MAAADIEIACFDPISDYNFDLATIYTRVMRSGLKFSSKVPGGNERASWSIDCTKLVEVGLPPVRARVLIWDPVRVKYLWRGVLQTPSLTYERGRLSRVDFTAVGCAEASNRQFSGPTVFGVSDVLATINGRVSVTSLGEIMQYGLTICPMINGSQDDIAFAEALTEDTHDYRGQSAPQLWEDTCNLTRALATPYIWLVEPDINGNAALEFFAETSTAHYFEHGTAKSNRLEIDFGQIANKVYVLFNGRMIEVPPNSDPLDYTATTDIQTAFVNVSDTIREYNTANGFAEGLYQKFNQRVVTGGSIVLDRDIRTNINGFPEIIPIQEIRVGRSIEIEITKTRYLEDVAVSLPIASAEYDEDNCTMTLSSSPLNQEGKNARLLAIRAEQAQAKMSWTWTDRALAAAAPPHPLAATAAESAPWVSHWTEGRVADPNGIQPSVSRRDGNGVIYGTGGVPTTFRPNSIPFPWNRLTPANATAYVIEHGAPLVARIRDQLYGIGVLGEKIHPQELPDERINIPAQFSTADPLTGDLTDGERMHTDVQEGWIDTFTISVLGGTSTTVTVKVDIWNWDDMDIRVADAFELDLDGESEKRYQYDNSDNDHRPVLLHHGDQLRWKVEDPADEVILNCCLSGDKNWGEFPVLIGPDWLPGNA